MRTLLKLIFKIPPLSVLPWALHHKRKLPGLLWVGGLGFFAWKRFGPQITERLQELSRTSTAPAPWSEPSNGAAATPAMAVAANLAPANGAPEIPDPVTEPDAAPVVTTG